MRNLLNKCQTQKVKFSPNIEPKPAWACQYGAPYNIEEAGRGPVQQEVAHHGTGQEDEGGGEDGEVPVIALVVLLSQLKVVVDGQKS